MAKPTNKDKSPEIDESILDETPPNINEPQTSPEEETETEKKVEDIPDEVPDESTEETETLPEEEKKEEIPPVVPVETQEEKDARYRSQQSEAQIQAARAKALADKVDEAAAIKEPTVEELNAFVAQDGVSWDDLTPFEQAQAKRTYISEKRFNLVNEAVQNTKKIDEWANKIDAFIDETDGKPEYVKLSGHEDEFRRFAMKESHRGVDIQSLLLPAFIQSLPAVAPKRGELFPTGGGGEKAKTSTKITDADEAKALRDTNPREYKRQLKAGNIQVEI